MTLTFAYVACALAGAAAFLALRLYPIWRQREQGCDAFNILLCAEAIRRECRLPPRVPDLFILEDEEQWYPPVFLALCALLPQGWLRRRYWLFNQLVDSANGALLFAAVALLTESPWLAGSALLVYAICAGLVQEFAVLTTRPLGLLVLNLLVLAGALAMQDSLWLIAALGCGILLVYAHKLSAQQAWLTLPVIFAATGAWVWTVLLPGMYAAAFLVWPRGFRRVIEGHIAIVRFWQRNWPLLGAHAVRQSPVYGDGGKTRRDFYAAWPKGAPLRFAKETLHQNYFVVPAAVGVLEGLVGGTAVGRAEGAVVVVLMAWIASVYAMAALTHFVTGLRGLGLGRQYVKFALLPSLCLIAVVLAQQPVLVTPVVALAALLLALRQYLLVARSLRGSAEEPQSSGQKSEALSELLAQLRRDDTARVLVLPVYLCDLVAYETRRPVYWGTHGQCFDERLERFFPVLRHPIADYAADGRLNRLLLDTRYAKPEELDLPPGDLMVEAGPFALYRLRAESTQIKGAADRTVVQAWA